MSFYELAIVDDQSGHAASLAVEVARLMEGDGTDERFHISRFESGTQFRAWVRGGARPDIVLMDILLGGRDAAGIELADELNRTVPDAQVIYVTGYIEYCTSVYQTDHVYFLTKPVDPDDLRRALRKAMDALDARRRSRIEVRFKGKSTVVLASEIDYIESIGRKVHIHGDAGEIETYAHLADLREQLPASFVQCHKSFLANFDRVESFEAKRLVFRSGAEVPVSQRSVKATRAAWERHLLGRL